MFINFKKCILENEEINWWKNEERLQYLWQSCAGHTVENWLLLLLFNTVMGDNEPSNRGANMVRAHMTQKRKSQLES